MRAIHAVNAELLERQVVETVKAIAGDQSGWIEEVCDRLQQDSGAATSHLEAEREGLRRELKAVKQRLDNLIAFVGREGTGAPKSVTGEIAKAEREMESLRAELEQKEDAIRAATPTTVTPDALRASFERLGELLDDATPQEQQTLLRAFVSRVDLHPDGLVLHVFELTDECLKPSNEGKDICSKTTLDWWR